MDFYSYESSQSTRISRSSVPFFFKVCENRLPPRWRRKSGCLLKLHLLASFKTSPTSFSFLYAVLLFGIAVSVGILHQAVIQNLRLYVKRYKADFEWSQSQLEHASRERNAARQRVKDVGVDLEDSYSNVKQYKADFELPTFGAKWRCLDR